MAFVNKEHQREYDEYQRSQGLIAAKGGTYVKHKGKVCNADVAEQAHSAIPLDREKLKFLLIKYKGNLTRVAIALGCARLSIQRIVRNEPEIKEILEDARERVIDDVEDAFTEKAIKGDTTAGIFFLKTRGRERGYDQDFRADIEAVTRAAMSFALNKSKNPAEAKQQMQSAIDSFDKKSNAMPNDGTIQAI